MKKNHSMLLASFVMAALTYSSTANAQQSIGEQIRQTIRSVQQQSGDRRSNNSYGRAQYLSDSDFSILYNKVKNASFDDRKFDLIEVASLGCWYSCSQTARIISLFSFSDKKLKALKMMAPHIADLRNAPEIYKQFTFSSDKDKAAEIIQNSGR